jgi:predicted GH43/DUF377 family glycosyl hydrolase
VRNTADGAVGCGRKDLTSKTTRKKRKKYLLILAIFSIAVLLIGQCSTPTPFSEFEKSPPDRPVISSGRAGVPSSMADPCVIKDDEGYHGFFTVLFFKKQDKYCYSYDSLHEDDYDGDDHVGTVAYAFSKDQGLTWTFRETPVVMPGPEQWQSVALETPNVLKIGDRLYLFYSALGERDGNEFESRYQIGVATLELDGNTVRESLMDESVHFVKKKDPLLPFNLEKTHHDNNTQEPSALRKDGKIELFYVGLKLKKPAESVTAAGQDIADVSIYRAVFDKELNTIESAKDALPYPALFTPGNMIEVHYHRGSYHMFSTESPLFRQDSHRDEVIAYCSSEDGEQWSGSEVILRKGDDAFDNWGVMAPTVVFEEDKVVLFYTAWEHEVHPGLPGPPDGRFGATRHGERTIYGTLGRATASFK